MISAAAAMFSGTYNPLPPVFDTVRLQ